MLSDKAEYCYALFRGVGYKDVPDRPYDFVFVDGPSTQALSDGARSFDFDYINVVMTSSKPVFGIIDKRLGISYVFQRIFGEDKVVYDPKIELCFVGPFTKADIKRRSGSGAFTDSLRIFGRTKLRLQMRP